MEMSSELGYLDIPAAHTALTVLFLFQPTSVFKRKRRSSIDPSVHSTLLHSTDQERFPIMSLLSNVDRPREKEEKKKRQNAQTMTNEMYGIQPNYNKLSAIAGHPAKSCSFPTTVVSRKASAWCNNSAVGSAGIGLDNIL